MDAKIVMTLGLLYGVIGFCILLLQQLANSWRKHGNFPSNLSLLALWLQDSVPMNIAGLVCILCGFFMQLIVIWA